MNTWQIVRRSEKRVTHPRLLSRCLDELAIDEVAMNDSEGKQYLIEHGVLRPRAVKWKRQRQYGYSAECWQRHEIKEAALNINNLWKAIATVYREERDQAAYNALPLRDRTQYEKLLSAPRPLTPEEYTTATAFVQAWKLEAGRCE